MKKEKEEVQVLNVHKRELVRQAPRQEVKQRSDAGIAADTLVKIGGSASSKTKKFNKININICCTRAFSPVRHLSLHEHKISGIEYKQIYFCKASLPGYYKFISPFVSLLLSTLISFYYPGPSFFPLPLLLSNLTQNSLPTETYTSDTKIRHKDDLRGQQQHDQQQQQQNNNMNPYKIPQPISPIRSPNHNNAETSRDPRIRKTQLMRAKNKLGEVRFKLDKLRQEEIKTRQNRKGIEDQLDAIKAMQGEHEYSVACYNWLSPRMRLDHSLEEIQKEKNKLKEIEKHVTERIQAFKAQTPSTPSPRN